MASGTGGRIGSMLAFGINSALAFASAELLTAALHETGHGAAAQLLGFSPRIYAFFEDNPSGTVSQDLIILSAGPIASLILGAVFLSLYLREPPRYSFARLLLFWMAWLGIMEFVNYLIVTPWLSAGDTAQIADRLGLATWIRYLIAAAGVAGVFLLSRTAAATMMALAPGISLATPAERRRFVMRGFYLPLIAGTALTALGGVGGQPIVVLIGLLGTFGNIDIVAAAIYPAGRAHQPQQTPASSAPVRVELPAVVLYLALVAAYVFVLSKGLAI